MKVDQCPKPLYRRTGGVEADRIGGNRWRWRRAVEHTKRKKKVIVKVGCNRPGRPSDGWMGTPTKAAAPSKIWAHESKTLLLAVFGFLERNLERVF